MLILEYTAAGIWKPEVSSHLSVFYFIALCVVRRIRYIRHEYDLRSDISTFTKDNHIF